FQFMLMLCAVLSAIACRRMERAMVPVMAGLTLLTAVNLIAFPPAIERSALPRQDFTLHVIDQVTSPGERVWDASGYVYTRVTAAIVFTPLRHCSATSGSRSRCCTD